MIAGTEIGIDVMTGAMIIVAIVVKMTEIAAIIEAETTIEITTKVSLPLVGTMMMIEIGEDVDLDLDHPGETDTMVEKGEKLASFVLN